MSAETKAIACPVCGTLMNHHADKLVYTADAADGSGEEEVLEEFYQCPHCEASASRLGSMRM